MREKMNSIEDVSSTCRNHESVFLREQRQRFTVTFVFFEGLHFLLIGYDSEEYFNTFQEQRLQVKAAQLATDHNIYELMLNEDEFDEYLIHRKADRKLKQELNKLR